ncbi:MAG: hypothetical protein ACKVPX_04450 [Myxococcaceae bacterium]
MNRALLMGIVVTMLHLSSLGDAHAFAFYVDASCSFNGNGRADQCATAAGGAGAWNGTVSDSSGGVQNCFNTLVAGDTCFIRNGTYITTWVGNDYRLSGGFHPMNSGTATAPITYRAYPGHRPVLVNCTNGTQSECSHQTISANQQSYIVYDGLTIVGAMYLLNSHPGPMGLGLEIKNCDVSVGWFGDGNWSGVYLEWWDGARVHHNRFHDIVPVLGAIQSGSGLKQYTSINTIVEYNTFENLPVRANGIDAKYDAVNNVFRYNLFRNINGNSVEFNSYSPGNLAVPGSGAIYGNIAYNVNTGIALIRNVSGLDVYNNTFVNMGEMYYQPSDGSSILGLRQWNNIVNGMNATGEGKLTNIYGPAAPQMSDYNVWQSGFPFTWANTSYSTLSDLQTQRGIDLHSQATNCSFVNASSDFHLAPGSTCLTAGRVGGTSNGAVVQVGAYGVTSCVGHTCAGGGPPPPPVPPAAPRNLTILR